MNFNVILFFIAQFTMFRNNLRRNRKTTLTRQRSARRMLVRSFRGASSTRRSLRFNRILSATSNTPELKTSDGVPGTPANNVVPMNTANSNISYINLIPAGSGFNNRVGRKIEMKSLHLKGVITQAGHNTTVMDYCRLAVIYDRQPNGAVTTTNNIFLSYASDSATATTPSSGVNPDERERFVVLADIQLALPPTTAATAGTSSSDGISTTYNINRFIKLNNLQTHYKQDSAPAVIGDIATGALMICGMGQLAAGAEGWQFVGTWRLRYHDT